MSEKEIDELINKIRGQTPSSELQKEVETLIREDEAKAKAKKEIADKLLEDIKTKEKLVKEMVKTDEIPADPPKRDKTGKFTKTPTTTPTEDEEKVDADDNDTIKKLTEQMAKMAEEIAALKNRKNYRTTPPAAKKVDEVDDFVKQNITKNFEMIV